MPLVPILSAYAYQKPSSYIGASQASKAADWLRGFMPDYDRLPAEAGDEREAA